VNLTSRGGFKIKQHVCDKCNSNLGIACPNCNGTLKFVDTLLTLGKAMEYRDFYQCAECETRYFIDRMKPLALEVWTPKMGMLSPW
jgi:uncharacterized protein with PIN domain